MTKGRIKIALANATIDSVVRPYSLTPLKVMRTTRAFFKKLSFSAPRNWVQNRGRNFLFRIIIESDIKVLRF